MNERAECLRLHKDNFRTCLATIDLRMQEFWKTTIFHHYTDHGYDHTRRIITHLEAILGDCPNLLNQQERFILLASVYLHDVGMQSPLHAGLERKEYTEYKLEEIETVRDLHHISSGQMILDSIKERAKDEFGLGGCGRYLKFVAEVARHHTKLDITLLKDTRHLGEEIRLPLLAALMRLGDALDLDSRRVNLDNLRYWDIPVLSKFHWWAHHYVSSVHIERGRIGLIFTFPEDLRDDPVLNEFKSKIEDSIKGQLTEVYPILYNYEIKLFHEPQVDDVVYDVEGVLQPIPQDLLDFVYERLNELARIQMKTGVHFYVDGVPYSDDPKVADSTARLIQLILEGKNEAARIEVERCLTFTLSPWQKLIVLNLAGNVYQVLGDRIGAQQRYDDALGICQRMELRDIYGKNVETARATLRGNLGIVYRYKGELNEALKHHKEALRIHREIGYKQGEAIQLGNLGIVYHVKGELDEALKHYEEGLSIHREIGFRQGEATQLGNMGIVYRAKGELDEALKHHKEALKINREIDYKEGEANQLGNMGIVYRVKGELDEALKHHEESQRIHREIGYRQGEATQLGNIGIVYHVKGELDEALKHHEEALKIHREIGYKEGEATDLGNMGIVYHAKNKLDETLIHIKAALKIYTQIQSPRAEILKKFLEELEKK